MECLLDYNLFEIQEKLKDFSFAPYRAKQIFVALHQGKSFNEMTNINNTDKNILNQNFVSQAINILQTKVSEDGTEKYLFKLADNNIIEGVLMRYKHGNTLCVSTQVGCGMGCNFCASGLNGIIRNLSVSEMLGQVVVINKLLNGGLSDKRKITNVVLMGSGEPLANYENVTKFLDLLADKDGLMMSERNISLSTCGIVQNIKRLADDDYKVTLSISLHAPTDEIRKSIMKIANTYSISQLIDACKYFYEKTGRRIMFEYILIKDVNSMPEHAEKLANLVKDLNAHVNLIPLNEVEGIDLKTVSRNETYRFQKILEEHGIQVTIRRTLGDDIDGACGQLRRSYLKTSN